jgi:beta-galactosidase
MHYGVDYYPEHLPEERWEEDAHLMAEAGFTVVRVGEFAWSLFEPQERMFTFDWLDRAIAVVAHRNIKVIIGTPSAAPPPWLTSAYPQVLAVTRDGQALSPGGRRFTCPTSPLYRRFANRIAQVLAEHYAGNQAVIGWQIDNELTYGNAQRCYCQQCQRGFQAWLADRYESLERLNQEWGTVFWSQVYTDWSQIPVPFLSRGDLNPGLELDYARYQSAANVSFLTEQLQILREICPDHSVTNNFGSSKRDTINNYDLGRELDFVSIDTYPGFIQMIAQAHLGNRAAFSPVMLPMALAWNYDNLRGIRAGQPFWVMEMQSGPTGSTAFSATPRPGQLRLWTYQALARGAQAIVHFRWDTCSFGAEQYCHGILDHDLVPRRRYAEIKQIAHEIQSLGDVAISAPIPAEIALLWSYESSWALTLQPSHPRLHYGNQHSAWYAPFYTSNIPIDIIAAETEDLSRYKVILAPTLYVLSSEVAQRLTDFVAQGGVLITGYRSGVKESNNQVTRLTLPGRLAEVIGAQISEYDAIYDQRQAVRFHQSLSDGPEEATCDLWADILEPTTARVLATYTQDFYAGKAAITLNSYNEGKAVYIGAALKPEALGTLLLNLTRAEGGVQPLLSTPLGVEITRRVMGTESWWFLLNHTSDLQQITLPGTFSNALQPQNQPIKGPIEIEPYGVRVLQPFSSEKE